MKLSEALRLGEFAVAPYRGSWFKRYADGSVCGACAIGRVCMAVGFIPACNPNLNPHEQFEVECAAIARLFADKWPWTLGYKGHTDIIDNPVAEAISDMYEYNGKSIQQIADWVATIEPQEAAHDLQPITDESGNEVHQVQQEAIQGR